MKKREKQQYIFQKMQEEMARRSPRACVAFIGAAIAFYLYHFGSTVHITAIQNIAAAIIIINLMRFYVSRKIVAAEGKPINMRLVWSHRCAVYLNALAYGVIVSVTLADYDHTFFNCWVIVCGITAASTASIVFDKSTIYAVIGFSGILPVLRFWQIAVESGRTYTSPFIMTLYVLFILIVSFDFHRRTIQSIEKDLAILEQKSKLQTILDSIPGFVLGFDLRGHLMATSKHFKNELLESLNPILHNFQESKNDFYSMEAELRLQETTHWFLISLVRTSSTLKYMMVGQPIDDLKIAQRSMEEQKAKAENSAKLATLGEMAGGVAHEINTPLGAIQLHTQMLSDYIVEHPELKADLEKRVNSIQSITDRIAKIIKGLRIFARNADKDPFLAISTQKIIEDTLALCYEKFKAVNLKIEVINLPTEIFVHGQDTQLCQVLLNLLNNAYDATSELESRWIRIEVVEVSGFAEIRVTDSGNGLTPEVQKKLFQPFFTTKDIGKGTGLGLSISKGILDSHKGKVYYDENAKNTCFVIQIPKSTEATAAA